MYSARSVYVCVLYLCYVCMCVIACLFYSMLCYVYTAGAMYVLCVLCCAMVGYVYGMVGYMHIPTYTAIVYAYEYCICSIIIVYVVCVCYVYVYVCYVCV